MTPNYLKKTFFNYPKIYTKVLNLKFSQSSRINKKGAFPFWYDTNSISKYPVRFDTEPDMEINIPFHTKRKGTLLQIIPIKGMIKRIFHVLTGDEKRQKICQIRSDTHGLAIGLF